MNNEAVFTALSPLDGRYFPKTSPLRAYFSDSALARYRTKVELLYFFDLLDFLKIKIINQNTQRELLFWADSLTVNDYDEVKKIEDKLHHDVKAVEYFIQKKLKKTGLGKYSHWVHWGLTSEDTNNLAYGLMVKDALENVFIPEERRLVGALLVYAEKYKADAMPARTHGQLAVPTTVGKELIVFASRAGFFLGKIISLKIGGKLNGAVGNYNAQKQIFPQKDWIALSHRFIKSLGLEPTLVSTQIEPATRLVYLFDLMRQLNNVWLDLAKDCWLYISLDYFIQKAVEEEVGSSTMPHKVNPIDFENAEGNLEIARGLLTVLADKLPVSRLQRDLSDSTVKRNIGTVFGYSLIAVKSLQRALGNIKPNTILLKRELRDHPEMLSEAVQLFLKLKGQSDAYELLKSITRGKKVNWPDLIKDLPPKDIKILQNWQTEKYIGLAPQLVEKEITAVRKRINLKRRKT